MAGLNFEDHQEREWEDADVIAHNSKMGVILFLVYVFFYSGFMVLSAFFPEQMSKPAILGVNLAIAYGCTLIVVALLLALVYMGVCRKSEKGSN